MNKATLAAAGHTDVSKYYQSIMWAYSKDKKAGLKAFEALNRKDRCQCICYMIDLSSRGIQDSTTTFAVIAAKAFTRWQMTFDNMFE